MKHKGLQIDPLTFPAGVEVLQVENVPAGMVAMSVPAQKYVVFECTLPTLRPTYGYFMELALSLSIAH